jgi:signal transduction histidine kinase
LKAGGGTEPALPAPPYEALRATLLGRADSLEAEGRSGEAGALRGVVEAWWPEQRAWTDRLAQLLSLHHEINNALVGVRGNAQLLLMGPAGKLPDVRDRLEVLIRESRRIQEAAGRIRELKLALDGPERQSRAA